MILREYRNEDASKIIKWIKNERELRLWSADRYGAFPITAEDINNNYEECKNMGAFYPMTLEDNNKIVGHIILRVPGKDKDVIRLGFIIVDSNVRGKGYGKTLIKETIKFAREKLKAREINLGVFANNDNAYNCYKSVGFKEIRVDKDAYQFYDEKWDCIEMILENDI